MSYGQFGVIFFPTDVFLPETAAICVKNLINEARVAGQTRAVVMA